MNINQERKLAEACHLIIDLENPFDVCMHELQRAHAIERATKKLIDGTATADDFLDLAEASGLDMDDYIENISDNIEFLLNVYPY